MDVASALLLTGMPGLAAITWPTLSRGQLGLIVAIVGLAVLLVVSARGRRRSDGHSPRAYAREQLARLREEGEIKQDLEELLVRVQQVATDLSAQLDSRSSRLDRVIRDSDARITHLERLIRAADGTPACDVIADDERRTPDGLLSTRAPREPHAQHARIYEMADAGRTTFDIAQASGRPSGEIELILALRPKCLA